MKLSTTTVTLNRIPQLHKCPGCSRLVSANKIACRGCVAARLAERRPNWTPEQIEEANRL